MELNKIDAYVQQITDLNTDVKGYEVKSILEDVFNDGVKKSKSLNKVEQEYIDGLNVVLSEPSYNPINKFALVELNKNHTADKKFIDNHTVKLCDIVVRQQLTQLVKLINKLQK